MSEVMAKALLAIGQGMHGRRVTVRYASLDSGRWQLEHHDVSVELVLRSDFVDLWVDGDFIETLSHPDDIASAAIAHLVGP